MIVCLMAGIGRGKGLLTVQYAKLALFVLQMYVIFCVYV